MEFLRNHFSYHGDLEKLRDYKNLYLTGDNSHYNLAIKELRALMDKLTTSKDIKRGVCVFLTNKARYQDVVTILDLGDRFTNLGVIPYDNKIFIFEFDAHSGVFIGLTHKGLLLDCLIGDTPEQIFFETTKKTFISITPFWPLIIPFAGMIYFEKRKQFRASI